MHTEPCETWDPAAGWGVQEQLGQIPVRWEDDALMVHRGRTILLDLKGSLSFHE